MPQQPFTIDYSLQEAIIKAIDFWAKLQGFFVMMICLPPIFEIDAVEGDLFARQRYKRGLGRPR